MILKIIIGPGVISFSPNTEFFLVRYFSVFNPITGKYGPEKTPYLDTFHTVPAQCSVADQSLFIDFVFTNYTAEGHVF